MPDSKTVTREEYDEIMAVASYFQDELDRHGSLILAFRWYRNGTITLKEFMERIGDECSESIKLGPAIPPHVGKLNDWKDRNRLKVEMLESEQSPDEP